MVRHLAPVQSIKADACALACLYAIENRAARLAKARNTARMVRHSVRKDRRLYRCRNWRFHESLDRRQLGFIFGLQCGNIVQHLLKLPFARSDKSIAFRKPRSLYLCHMGAAVELCGSRVVGGIRGFELGLNSVCLTPHSFCSGAVLLRLPG